MKSLWADILRVERARAKAMRPVYRLFGQRGRQMARLVECARRQREIHR